MTFEDMPDPGDDLPAFRRWQAGKVIGRIPVRYRDARVDNLSVRQWVDGFVANPGGAPSLMLAGETGVGKTYLAYGALKACLLGCADAGRALTVAWTTHADLNAELRPQPDDSHRHALERYLTADLTLLDDLAAGLSSEWTADSLYRLVDTRWSQCRPMITTCNLGPAQLSAQIGDRVLSRVQGMSTVVILNGEDRRRSAS